MTDKKYLRLMLYTGNRYAIDYISSSIGITLKISKKFEDIAQYFNYIISLSEEEFKKVIMGR